MNKKDQFRVIIKGINPDFNPIDVIKDLAQLFKTSTLRFESLNRGSSFTINQILERDKADFLKKKLIKVGCIVSIIEVQSQLDSSPKKEKGDNKNNLNDKTLKENIETGEIKIFFPEKGFGFIDSNNGENVFFHISDVVDKNETPIVSGDLVEFLIVPSIKKGKKCFDAKNVKRKKMERKWKFGVIVSFFHDKGYGFIRQGANQESVFFHFSAFNNTEGYIPYPAQYVNFTNETRTEEGISAGYVSLIEKYYGEVVAWKDGHGEILPINSENSISVFWKDIILPRKEGYRALDKGEIVSFLFDSQDPNRACLVRKEYNFRKFANLGNEHDLLKHLAEDKALSENWSYSNDSKENPYRILWNYLCNTYLRLEYEDLSLSPEKKKIVTVERENEPNVTIFNTGLIDKKYDPLYAVFLEESAYRPGIPSKKLIGFCARGERIDGTNWLTLFRKLPDRAEYFDDPSKLLYNNNIRMDAVTSHVVGDRGNRLPERVRERVPKDMTDEDQIISHLNNHLEMAIKRALERIKWNYKAAIPQYYNKTKKIQLLIPLCIDDPRIVDLALAVERENQVYVGYTILKLDWAYNNARLIARPDSDWLTPSIIQSEIIEDD